MFRHEGPARDPRLNARLAAYLACVAGFVNSGGFMLLGTFTSHVTGNIGRASTDLAAGELGAAAAAFSLGVSFLLGAFVASLVLEGSPGERPRAYGVALILQAALLGGFVLLAGLSSNVNPRGLDGQAALLCAAMGMQNSLVTRLSGAVVRTTHLTGIVTDLGIELARLARGTNTSAPARIKLLLTIVLAFAAGSLLGALLTLRSTGWAMLWPAVATLGAGLYALSQRARLSEPPPAR